MTDRDYQHSRPLDVHRWSEHKEANGFVDYVYDTYLNTQSNENKRIKKKHLKVVLLDLYVAWLNDPDLNIAFHMTTGAYSDGTVFKKGKSRYNELNIKVSTIEIVHRLLEADLIGFQKGFEGSSEWQGYISRIWPTNKLTKLFEDVALVNLMLGMMKSVKPSFYVMRIKMMSSTTILKMSSECVQTLKNTTSYLKKPSLIFNQ